MGASWYTGVWHTHRVGKLGKAFQNWRRAILHALRGKQLQKSFFLAWRNACPLQQGTGCMADMIWTEDDMDHFLITVASFSAHKRSWKEQRQERAIWGNKNMASPCLA